MDFDYSTETITPDNSGTLTLSGTVSVDGDLTAHNISATSMDIAGKRILTTADIQITVGTIAPASPNIGDLWVDTN